MACVIASWILFLHLLVLLLAQYGSEARKMSTDHLVHQDLTSSSTINLPSDLSASVFFKIEDMKKGKTMKLYLLKKEPSSSRLLPRQKADSIPFSSKHLPYLVNLFGFPQGSRQALEMKKTLRDCESAPIKGETKFCATSLESMLDFVLDMFKISELNSDDHPTLLTSVLRSEDQTTLYQNYTALKAAEEVLTSKAIACHSMPYPYSVFYCHAFHKGTEKVYKIPFVADNGDELDALALCHVETSEWDPSHVSFRALGTAPGSPVCHIFPPHGNYIWVHTPRSTTASI